MHTISVKPSNHIFFKKLVLLRDEIIGQKSHSSKNRAGFYPRFIWLRSCIPNLLTTPQANARGYSFSADPFNYSFCALHPAKQICSAQWYSETDAENEHFDKHLFCVQFFGWRRVDSGWALSSSKPPNRWLLYLRWTQIVDSNLELTCSRDELGILGERWPLVSLLGGQILIESRAFSGSFSPTSKPD